MALRQVLRSDVPVSFADINKFAQSKSVSGISNDHFNFYIMGFGDEPSVVCRRNTRSSYSASNLAHKVASIQ